MNDLDVVSQTPATKRALLNAGPEALADWMTEQGSPPFHARQVYNWVFTRRAVSFDAMSDLPKRLRAELESEWIVYESTVAHRQISPDGTDKLVLACSDGRRVECVLMAEQSRRSVCVSTQVGCGMGCVFCASGLTGIERNLTRGEIVEQVLRARNLL